MCDNMGNREVLEAVMKINHPLLEYYNSIAINHNEYYDLIKYDFSKAMELWAKRDLWIKKYSFAILSLEAIKKISKFSPIIEVGAGTGYNAWLLSQAGAEIEAYDKYLPQENKEWNFTADYFPINIIKRGINIFNPDEHRTLFLCWPPMGNMAYKFLNLYLNPPNNGKTVIYVGENSSGCTANENFWNRLNKLTLIDSIIIPNWLDISDKVYIYSQ